MTVTEAIEQRHAVRRYTDRKLGADVLAALNAEIAECNAESGLNLQLVTDEPEAFGGLLSHYGRFSNVRNYLALVGKKAEDLDEKVGYYGERLVLLATTLGLDSCWVAGTFRRGKCACRREPGDALPCVLALGYGETHGKPHKSKPLERLCHVEGDMPDWFRSGMEAALLAPTAVNQQKFRFTLSDRTVKAEATGGFSSRVDLGIVKYHFECGAGKEHFRWA